MQIPASRMAAEITFGVGELTISGKLTSMLAVSEPEVAEFVRDRETNMATEFRTSLTLDKKTCTYS